MNSDISSNEEGQNRLFVYGTLAPGCPNEHVLQEFKGSWIEGTVKGRLIEKGWGAPLGYPALILDAGGDLIKGFIFSSDKLSLYWDRLDEFEGPSYKRTMTTVQLGDQTMVQANIYVLNREGSE